MCTVAPARSHEVQLGVEQGIEGQSNVFRSIQQPVSDGTYVIRPTLRLAQPEGGLTYRLDYQPAYTAYFDTDGINGFDHTLNGRGRYQLAARDAIKMGTTFRRFRNLRTQNFVDVAGQSFLFTGPLGTTQRFQVDLGLEHAFSARTQGSVTLDYERWDYTAPGSVGNQGYGLEARLDRAFGKRLVLGASGDARYRAFDEATFTPASYSTVVNGNLLARLDLTDSLKFQASGGPAGVLSRQGVPGPRAVSRYSPVFDPANCANGYCGRLWAPVAAPSPSLCGSSFGVPVMTGCIPITPVTLVPGFPDELVVVSLDPNQNVFGRETESLTYFVTLSLEQQFRRGSLIVSFVRNEDAGGGGSTATILNLATARLAYRLSDRTNLVLSGLYNQRESITQFPFTQVSARASTATDDSGTLLLAEAGNLVAGVSPSNFEVEVGSIEALLTRQLTEQSFLRFRFQYYRQQQVQLRSASQVAFDNYLGGVLFVYEFESYKL